MGIMVGSARHDENGKYINGKVGDQLQKNNTLDLSGEVSQQKFYVHSKGWNVLRPITCEFATEIAKAMEIACNNPMLGYGQECTRKTPDNITSIQPINLDCSKLVRDCVFYASGVDVGNFTTANEVGVLEKSGLFMKSFPFKSLSSTPLYDGDVLVTKTKGHTVIVTSGNRRITYAYFPKYNGTSGSLVEALISLGVKDTSLEARKPIAMANGIRNYTGTASQNTELLTLLKRGILIKPY